MADENAHSSRFGGGFVVSLDLELMWGVYGTHTASTYGENVLGVRRAVPALLDLFAEFEIACTWAVVGMLCFDRRDEMLRALPSARPSFGDARLSSYAHLDAVGADEASDPYHLGRSLVEAIASCPRQEIGTHTFAHYYCMEALLDATTFAADLDAALETAGRMGVTLRSIVFPRNQVVPEALALCRERGITVFRGTGAAGPSRARRDERWAQRALRLVRSYVPEGSAARGAVSESDGMIDVPASRFLRPHRRVLPLLSAMQASAVRREMRDAGRSGALYHLWFHPHNFGVDTETNIAMLRTIVREAVRLRDLHGWPSLTMAEAAGFPRADVALTAPSRRAPQRERA